MTVYSILPKLAEKCLKAYKKDPNTYNNFGELHFYDRLFSNINAILLITIYLRTFKYLSLLNTIHNFSITIFRSAVDLFWFVCLFLIMVLAYAMAGVIMFGNKDKNFINLRTALLSLLRMLISHIDYDSMKHANSTFSGVFVSTFIFIVFFFILVSNS